MGQGEENLMKTLDAARGRWPGILQALGVDPKFLRDVHGPCPICQGKDRYRFDDKDGDGTYYCSQCGAGAGIQLLQKLFGWDFPKAAYEVDQVVGNVQESEKKAEQTEEQKRVAHRRVLKSAFPLEGENAAVSYLVNRCPGGIEKDYRKDLRFHPGMAHPSGETYPCLLAIIRNHDRTGASIHRTFITSNGQKAPVDPVRMVMPGTIKGACVMLGTPKGTLGIAEGIETALCAAKIHGHPVWACISAGNMQEFEPPEGIKTIVIYGDNDLNFVGQHAAYAKARKLHKAGIAVTVRIPDEPGKDWCDVWAGMSHG